MRLSRFGLIAMAALVTVGCQRDDGSLEPTAIPPLAYVRYINALPDTNSTTVRFIDQLEFSPMTWANVPYRGLGHGNYQGTQAGSRQFRIFTFAPAGNIAGNTVALTDVTHNFEAGKYYTVLYAGYARPGSGPSSEVRILQDEIPSPGGSIAIRGINAAAGNGSLDFYLTPTTTSDIAGAPAFASVGFGASSAYLTQGTGAFAVRVTASGSTAPLASVAAAAGANAGPNSDPTPGHSTAGSVLTAVAFSPSVSGSNAAAAANPTVVMLWDRQPPRSSSP